jgi:L-2-hydroxyglutarate oxidase LhgO
MNIASDRCFGLNATGAAVLSCLEKGVTDPAVIAESLAANAQENGIEVELDRVFSDVSAFLEALKAAGILE